MINVLEMLSKRRMALQHEKIYTIEHIYTLPEGQRAELISGQMHMMAPPTRVHQKLISELTQHIGRYIKQKDESAKFIRLLLRYF